MSMSAGASSGALPDGSGTTTIKYADGTKINMTTPASSTAGGTSGSGTSNPSTTNLLEQLIQLQSQILTAATSTLSTIVYYQSDCWSRLANGFSSCGNR
jgi:hypothetical protein